MLYNLTEKPNYIQTAGKITIAAAISGVLIFAFLFLFNAGKTELMKVEAQSATTTITVLNTPPQWLTLAYEEIESSTSSPTNSGSQISWVALAENNGGAPYYLIVCSTSATPTIPVSDPPYCNGGVQWGVSTATVSNTQARVASTTTEVGDFSGEILPWFAWVCDNDPVNPRCNNTYSQGLNATNSSPFHVNFRPTLTAATSTSPIDPGAVLSFTSTSADGNVVRGPDNIFLYVCNGNDFVPATRTCVSGLLASTSGSVTSNAGASFTLPSVVQDDAYDAYVYLVDQYNHPASGGFYGQNIGYIVNNVAPTLDISSVQINGGIDITLTEGIEQTGYTLAFTTSDANSCVNYNNQPEMRNYVVSLLRSGVGTSTCNGTAGSYNPNNCYPSGVATTTWNLSCTASTTSCGGNNTNPLQPWSCTFPLWFLTDPTDSGSPFSGQDWIAFIAGVDDNNATGTAAIGTNTVDVISLPALDLVYPEIPYGALEPGDDSGTLTASTTVISVGNTGLNQNLEGESMCPGFAVGNPCPNSASSTIPDYQQEFATSSVAYGTGTNLSSTTPQLLETRIKKSTSTSALSSGITYWGIGVPIEITVAGAYTGLNTFYAVSSASSTWY
ncbi:MAG TPA: hypothetical protein PKD95_03780 [Candidatus Paceibacterota bacterium]|nr:hypothetical protein [Candidatus Paceibacterota bacterium]